MRRPWLVTSLCIVVIGLGGIGLHHESKAELQRALASFRANLPPDARFEYDRAYPRILARGAGFENARFVRGPWHLSAHKLTVNNPSGFLVSGLSFSHIHADGVAVTGPVTGRIDKITFRKLILPPIDREAQTVVSLPAASQLRFNHSKVQGLDLVFDTVKCTLTIAEGTLDNYGHDDGNAGTLHDTHALCQRDSTPARALYNTLDQKRGPLAFDVQDLQESGLRVAKAIAWVEHLDDKDLSSLTMLTRNLWEFTAFSRIRDIALSIMLMQFHARTIEQQRWKEGTTLRSTAETNDITFQGVPPTPSGFFFSGENRIARLTETYTTNLETHLTEGTVRASTPRSFSLQGEGAFLNLEGQDMTEVPRLASLDLTYRDEGDTVNAVLQHGADMHNVPLDQFKAQQLLALATLIPTAPGLSALQNYLRNPAGHSLKISFHPPIPLGVKQAQALSRTMATDHIQRLKWLSPPIFSTSIE